VQRRILYAMNELGLKSGVSIGGSTLPDFGAAEAVRPICRLLAGPRRSCRLVDVGCGPPSRNRLSTLGACVLGCWLAAGMAADRPPAGASRTAMPGNGRLMGLAFCSSARSVLMVRNSSSSCWARIASGDDACAVSAWASGSKSGAIGVLTSSRRRNRAVSCGYYHLEPSVAAPAVQRAAAHLVAGLDHPATA